MASPNCTNTDISGIGVRSATYAQNLLSFVPAVIALLNDGKISNNEREFIQDQSTNILLTAFGLLLSAIVQAKTAQGLDNYHLALVLNLSWMNNTNTFIYLLLFLHRKIWSSASYSWSWRRTISQIFRRSSKPKTGDESSPEESPPGKKTAPGKSPPGNEYAPEEESEPLLDLAVCIGSLHLSMMGALGIWLWLNPEGFGSSHSCPPGATIFLFSHAFPMGSHVLRVFSLIVYIAVLIPIANLVLPTALILVPYFLCPLGKWDRSHRERVAVWCVALGLAMLFTINVIFIVDTELSISRNESRQADQDEVWTLGQTLALLLLVLPIKSLIQYLLTTTSFTLPFMGVTAWGRAVQGFLTYNEKVEWGEVYRWRWIIRDTPIKVDSDWLLRAVAEKQWDIVRFLHENGADWDTGLVHAVEKGAFKVVRSLVERGANVNYRDYFGQTPLHLAAEHGYSDIASFLVEHGADINSENISGKALLHLAAEHSHLGIASFLVQQGAKVNIRDDDEKTPLHLAAEHGHLNIVNFLVANSADVNSRDDGGKTPLRLAAEHGHSDIVRSLVEHGADVNSSDGDKKTALHLAAEYGHLDIVRSLVEHGADVNSSDGKNKTALDLAAKRGHSDIESFLRAQGQLRDTRAK